MAEINAYSMRGREARERLKDQESRHLTNVGFLTKMGVADDHPSLMYHQNMLDKVQTELGRYSGDAGSALPSVGGLVQSMRPREGKPPTIEMGMEAQARKNLGKRDDDAD